VPQNSPKVLGTVGWKFDFELGLNFGINKINKRIYLYLTDVCHNAPGESAEPPGRPGVSDPAGVLHLPRPRPSWLQQYLPDQCPHRAGTQVGKSIGKPGKLYITNHLQIQ